MAINPIYHILEDASPGIWSDEFELSRYDHLIRIGQIEKYLYFVKEGAVRVYFSSGEAEHTIRLGYQGNILNALPSFLSRQPSTIAIEVLKKAVFNGLIEKPFLSYLIPLPNFKKFGINY